MNWSPANGREANPLCPRENNDNKTQTNGTKHICYDSTFPSTEASRSPTRLAGMVLVKGAQETAIQDVVPRNPRLLLRAIPLTIDNELEAISTPIDIQNAPHPVGWTTIINIEGRRRLGWRDQIHLIDQLNLRDVESTLNLN